MQEKLTKMFIMMQLSMMNMLEDFKKEEKGASDIVAIILIIVVIIAVAAIFKETLTDVMTSVMDKLKEFVG